MADVETLVDPPRSGTLPWFDFAAYLTVMSLSRHIESYFIRQRQEWLNSCNLSPLRGLGDELTATYDHHIARLPYTRREGMNVVFVLFSFAGGLGSESQQGDPLFCLSVFMVFFCSPRQTLE
jgi:hypothetical protein